MYYNMKNPHGGDIYEKKIRYDFSANVNPYGAPAAVVSAARNALDLAEKYPDPYCRELVRKIAGAQEVPESFVFCGNGASELIFAYCMAAKPEKALLAVPTFAEYQTALKRAGAALCYYYLKKENGFTIREDLCEKIREEKPDVVFLCNPNNPTGIPIRPETLEKIVAAAKETDCRLFVDECFYELSDERITLKDQLADYKGLFLLRAFTKSFGMAGIRLGYCFTADAQLLTEMATFTPPWSVSGPAQAAGVAALSCGEFLAETKKKIREERTWLTEQLKDLGLTVYPSQVNYIFFEGPADLQLRLRKQGIEIRSCENYEGLGPGYFRIAVRTHPENEALVLALRQA